MNMNIAASNVIQPPTQGRTDLPASTGTSPDGDAAGGDPTTVVKGDPRDFGRILSGSMKAGNDAPRTTDGDGKVDAAMAAAIDAADAAAEHRPPVDLGAALQGKGDPSKPDATDALKSKTGDDKKDDATDAVSSDVAAQLALATQWAATTPAHPTSPSDAAVTDDKSAPKTKVDDRRAGNARIAAARTVLTTSDVAQVQAAAMPAALNAVALGGDRNARSPTTAAVATIGKAESPKDEAAKLATPESKTVSIDKLFNLAAAGTSTSSADPSTIASQFVSQVTAQVSSAQNAVTATAATGPATLHEPVGSPAWSHELGQAAIRMATNDLQNAQLRLNPEHLGPLDVQLRIDNGVAHMQFIAAHADTRHALESSRATLDQMFGDQGIKLGDWSVGHSPSNGSFARSFGTASSQGDGSGQSTGNGDAGADAGIATVTVRTSRPLGLVDTFA